MFRFLFSFYGRTGRVQFWIGLLLVMILSFAGIMVAPLLDGVSPLAAYSVRNAYTPSLLSSIYILGLTVIFSISALALSVRRCHDRGHSGWWYLVSIIPIVGVLWWFINLGLLPGEKGPNRFGPDPRGRIDAEVFA